MQEGCFHWYEKQASRMRLRLQGKQMSKQCNRCGKAGLVWKQSKKGNWYLAVEQKWQGDMYGAIRTFYPAHKCVEVESYERNESFLFDLQARSGA